MYLLITLFRTLLLPLYPDLAQVQTAKYLEVFIDQEEREKPTFSKDVIFIPYTTTLSRTTKTTGRLS